MDVRGLADEVKETLVVNAALLARCLFIDMNAPPVIFGDIPGQ